VASMTAGQRVGLGLLVAFYALAGAAHLTVTDAMVRIVPGWVPFPTAVVIATGMCELLGAAGLCLPRWRPLAGRLLALYALCVWPANVRHAMLDLSGGTGFPIWYHAPRLAAQPLLIWWAWWGSRLSSSAATRS
jgi:uncharacterized membrane protein